MQMAPLQLSVRLVVIIAAVFTVFLLIGGPADAEANPVVTSEYVVASGDTLWSVASDLVGPGEDVRRLIADIRDVTGMTNSNLYPGQIPLIP